VTNIRRYPANGAPVFVTAVCRERYPYLRPPACKQLLLDIMREVKQEAGFSMVGYVILDEHFHLLVNLRSTDLSRLIQSVKLRFTRRLDARKSQQGAKSCWQPRFWDHIIRNQADLSRHLDYIHYNPVKHGYVKQPADYEFSSFSTYSGRGAYALDWGIASVPSGLESIEFE
jgi:putative transposase